jgi:MinD superfamily P-loop ATPase
VQIAVASGKGGTGKTTVATSLAYVAARSGDPVHLLDCDVEAPNCFLFLGPELVEKEPVHVSVPAIDSEKCTGCGECANICEFNALAVLPSDVLVFPELCHSCAGCWLVCPEQAITPQKRQIGWLEHGWAADVRFTQGRLRIGEAQAPPLIRQVKATAGDTDLCILDAPPGTSCPVVATLEGSDFVLLVTEPTPFGLFDLNLAVELVRELDLRCAVVINRADSGDDRVIRYCASEGLEVLLEIPHERRIAEAYSRGCTAAMAASEWEETFHRLYMTLLARAAEGVH